MLIHGYLLGTTNQTTPGKFLKIFSKLDCHKDFYSSVTIYFSSARSIVCYGMKENRILNKKMIDTFYLVTNHTSCLETKAFPS